MRRDHLSSNSLSKSNPQYLNRKNEDLASNTSLSDPSKDPHIKAFLLNNSQTVEIKNKTPKRKKHIVTDYEFQLNQHIKLDKDLKELEKLTQQMRNGEMPEAKAQTKIDIINKRIKLRISKSDQTKTDQLPQLQIKTNQLIEENTQFKTENLKLIETNEHLKKINSQLAKENTLLKEPCSELIQTNTELMKINSQLAEENILLKKSYGKLMQTNTESMKINSQLEEENILLKESYSELMQTNTKLTKTNIESNEKIEFLEKTIAQLQNEKNPSKAISFKDEQRAPFSIYTQPGLTFYYPHAPFPSAELQTQESVQEQSISNIIRETSGELDSNQELPPDQEENFTFSFPY